MERVMRLGVFLPNWVGDVVMATPALRALRKLAGDGQLVGVMRPYVAEVLGGCTSFDETILYAKKAKEAELAWPAVRVKLRAAKLDGVVLLTNSLRTAWMAYRSGAPVRIGIAGNLRSPLLTTKVYMPRRGWRAAPPPTVLGYLSVAQAAGCAPEAATLELATTAEDEAAADAVWQRLKLPLPRREGKGEGLATGPNASGHAAQSRVEIPPLAPPFEGGGSNVAVFNTGGAFGAAKDWPAEHFAALARRIAVERGMHVLINCGPAEREAARGIAAAANHGHVVSLADEPQLPIGLTKAAIRRAALLVSTDSGPRFFGVAFGVPTVTLFGPTSTEFTRTYAAHEVSVSLALDCQPCMERQCPLVHHRCMRELSVERVYAAVEAALGAMSDRRAAA
jgi:heptosyltransferase-2